MNNILRKYACSIARENGFDCSVNQTGIMSIATHSEVTYLEGGIAAMYGIGKYAAHIEETLGLEALDTCGWRYGGAVPLTSHQCLLLAASLAAIATNAFLEHYI